MRGLLLLLDSESINKIPFMLSQMLCIVSTLRLNHWSSKINGRYFEKNKDNEIKFIRQPLTRFTPTKIQHGQFCREQPIYVYLAASDKRYDLN